MFTLCGFLGVSGLLIVLGLPLAQRRVAPNLLYGLRVPATMSDEWVWYEANAHSGRDLICLGIAQAALALGLAWGLRLPFPSDALVNCAFLLVGTAAFAGIGWRRANSLLHSRQSGASGTDL